MTIEDKGKDGKMKNSINRETAKISALSSGKIHKCEYPTGEELLPSDKSGIIQEATFTYFPLGKVFKNKQNQLKSKAKRK